MTCGPLLAVIISFITRVLATSIGLITIAVIIPAMNEAVRWRAIPSLNIPLRMSICLMWSYDAICTAVPTVARCTVGAIPRYSPRMPSWLMIFLNASYVLLYRTFSAFSIVENKVDNYDKTLWLFFGKELAK